MIYEVSQTILVPLSTLSVGHFALGLFGKSVLPRKGRIQEFVLSLTLGLTFLSLIPYLLNLVLIDVRPFFWAFYFLGLAYASFYLLKFAIISRRGHDRFHIDLFGPENRLPKIVCLVVVILAAATLITLALLNRGNDWDAIQLYLPMARIVYEKGVLPVHSQEIGRDIVNFFLVAYVYAYGMIVSGDYLYPLSIIGIVSSSLLGLVGTTYEISSKVLGNTVDRLLVVASLLTLPVMVYYFAWFPRYADIPSLFLVFGASLFVLNLLNSASESRATTIARSLIMGTIAFAAVGFKIQNLLLLTLVVVLFLTWLVNPRRKTLAVGILFLAFVFSVIWALNNSTLIGGLAGDRSPIFIILGESTLLLLAFAVLCLRTMDPLHPTGLPPIIAGVVGGFAAWFVRPTLIESSPFFPISLPNKPDYTFAREIYSGLTRFLFASPLSQYGTSVPYLGFYFSPLLLPLMIVGAYSLLRRNQPLIPKWILLLNAGATFLTAYVDPRYGLWVAPLSGILLGESIFWLRKRMPSYRDITPLIPLAVMSLGLDVVGESLPVHSNVVPLVAVWVITGSLYSTLVVLSLPAKGVFKRAVFFHSEGVRFGGALLLAALTLSILSITYVNLVTDEATRQAPQPPFEKIYGFLESNVSQGSTVLSVGFPGIYYRTGLSSIPLDDPEGLARIYPFATDSNVSRAVIGLSRQMSVSSIVVPTAQNTFWYSYFGSLRDRVPVVAALTSQPISRLGFADSFYDVYILK